jgi:DNA-directed RNA polymerase specialized sigma24 family protein
LLAAGGLVAHMTMRTPKARASRKPPGTMTCRPGDAQDISQTVADLYQEHYRFLVRLTVLLVSDLATAEGIVQQAFADLNGTWRTLPGHDAALRYLRRSLIRRSRAAEPQQAGAVADQGADQGGAPGGGPEAGLLPALRALPVREREVLVLRYFADLPEAEIALLTGMRVPVVRTYATRGMSSLRAVLPGNVA